MERGALSDREIVARQIGRDPRGECDVVSRCRHGFPRVLRVPPIVDGEPFPTLFWLTCPFLCRAVGALEAAGWVGRLEAHVAADGALRDALSRAHERYVAERTGLDPGDVGVKGGIGGIADRSRLKCLHLHVAHALARQNPIGELVLAMLDEASCPPGKQICSLLAGGSRSSVNR